MEWPTRIEIEHMRQDIQSYDNREMRELLSGACKMIRRSDRPEFWVCSILAGYEELKRRAETKEKPNEKEKKDA